MSGFSSCVMYEHECAIQKSIKRFSFEWQNFSIRIRLVLDGTGKGWRPGSGRSERLQIEIDCTVIDGVN